MPLCLLFLERKGIQDKMGEYNRRDQRVCACCGKIKKFSSFYPDYRIQGEYLPFCKTCATQKFQEAVEACGDTWGALWCVLAQMNIPMLATPLKIVKQQYNERLGVGRKPDVVNLYYTTIRDLSIDYSGIWENEFSFEDFVDVEKPQRDKSTEKIIDYEQLVRTWGKFTLDTGELDVQAYDFLEEVYEMYTNTLFDMDASMVMRYRDLAKAELIKRRADENGDVVEIAKAQDNLKKMLSLLKLDDFKSNERSEMEKHIERICWTIENVKPAECEDLNKYRDFSGFEKTWDTIKRCVLNAIARSKDYPELPKDLEV